MVVLLVRGGARGALVGCPGSGLSGKCVATHAACWHGLTAPGLAGAVAVLVVVLAGGSGGGAEGVEGCGAEGGERVEVDDAEVGGGQVVDVGGDDDLALAVGAGQPEALVAHDGAGVVPDGSALALGDGYAEAVVVGAYRGFQFLL